MKNCRRNYKSAFQNEGSAGASPAPTWLQAGRLRYNCVIIATENLSF
jgi:hypothetical protein